MNNYIYNHAFTELSSEWSYYEAPSHKSILIHFSTFYIKAILHWKINNVVVVCTVPFNFLWKMLFRQNL